MKFIATTSDKINSIEVKMNQMIFSRDDRTIYLDSNERTAFQSIITLATEAQRVNMTSPVNKAYYFVEETCVLYYYDSSWKTITTPPDEKTIFTGEEGLPIIGKESTLYITKTGMYQWDKDASEFVCMGGEDLLAWHPLN